MSMVDKISGRLKKTWGDITDDGKAKRRGRHEEQKGEAKEDLSRAEDKAQAKAEEVSHLERKS
jgi:uncharacterized protein YjbJ (UPF0337 family)